MLNVSFHAHRLGQEATRLSNVRLVVAASTPMPMRLTQAEALLASEPVSRSLIFAVAKMASEQANVLSDQRGTESYRREMIQVVTGRALRSALGMGLEDLA
jgi:aerobic carbon-monoxide dehydrogenase medium subunit